MNRLLNLFVRRTSKTSSSSLASVPRAVSPRPNRSALRPLALEQRFMFDGAAIATGDAVHAAPDAPVLALADVPAAVEVRAAEPSKDNGRKEVVVVDTSVADYKTLEAGIAEGIGIVEIDGGHNGLAQLAKWAETQSGYDSISILSHGSEAKLRLGSTTLASTSFGDTNVQAELAQIGRALTADGDLLLYGCNIAAGTEGKAFIADLAQATGADVAASTDTTGAAAKGGDWALETQTGAIDVRSLALIDYQSVLSEISFFSGDLDIRSFMNTSVTRIETVSEKAITFSAVDNSHLDYVSNGLYSPDDSLGVSLRISAPAGYTFDITSFYAQMKTESLSIKLTYADGQISTFTLSGISESALSLLENFVDSNGVSHTINDVTQVELSSSDSGVFNNFVITDVKSAPSLTATINVPGGSYWDTAAADTATTFPNATGSLSGTPSATTHSDIASYGIAGVTTRNSEIAGYDFKKDGAYGTLYVNSTSGACVYVPNPAAIDGLGVFYSWGGGVTRVDSFTVTTTDDLDATGQTTLAIHLNGVDDTPIFSSATSVSIAENSSGTVYTAEATDCDREHTLTTALYATQAVAYSISDGADADLFKIDANTGAVSFKTAPDFEAPGDSGHDNVYDITVTATFTNTNSIENPSTHSYETFTTIDSASRDVQITVTDTNDAPELTAASRVLTGITENDTDNAGQTIAEIVGASITDADSNALEGIAITGLSSGNGTWDYSKDNGSTWIAVGAVAGNSALLLRDTDKIRFVPNGVAGTTASITYRAWDQTSGSAGDKISTETNGGTTAFSTGTNTASITVTSVNDAPTDILLTSSSIGQSLGSNGTVGTLSATDVDSSSFAYTLVSGTGSTDNSLFSITGNTLKVNNAAVMTPGTYSVRAQVSDGTDTYQKVFSVTVNDDVRPTFDVAPAATNINTNGFDLSASLDEAGTIYYVILADGASAPSVSQIIAGQNASGAMAIGSGYLVVSSAPYTCSFGITGLNEASSYDVYMVAKDKANNQILSATKVDVTTSSNTAPVFSNLNGGATFTEKGSAVVMDNNVTVADTELDARNSGQGNYSGASISVARNGGANTDDSFGNSGLLGTLTQGQNFTYNATVVGSVTTNSAGALTLTFNSNATSAIVSAVLQSLTYNNSSNDPPSSVTLNWTFNDGSLNSSGTNQAVLSITPVNDAPVISNTTVSRTLTEDSAQPFSASDFGFSDVDSGDTLQSITIVSAPGAGELFIDENGDGVCGVGDTLLGDGAVVSAANINKLIFRPAANANGAGYASFTWKVSDGAALSGNTGTMTLNVTPINDAPVISNTSGSKNLAEDSAQTFSAADFGFSDVDSGDTLQSITIVTAPSAGELFIDANSDGVRGGSDTLLGNGAVISAANIDKLTFRPTANANGTGYASFTWKVSDGTASSGNTGTMTLNVTSVNDAPSLSSGVTVPLTPTTEDATSSATTISSLLSNAGYGDVDSGASSGIAITATAGNGGWQYSTDGGANWFNVGTVSSSSALLLSATAQIRYVPDSANGETASLTFRAWDQTSGITTTGSSKALADVSTSGGSSAFSSNSALASLVVTSVNDAPTVGSPVSPQSATKDMAFSFAVPGGVFVDVDSGDTLTLSATQSDGSALPTWLSFNPSTRTFSGTPGSGDVGSLSVRITATDNGNATVSTTFSLTVNNSNQPPVVSSPVADQAAAQGGSFSFAVPVGTFTDPDVGETLTLRATRADGSALPSWLSFDPSTRTFSGTPANGDVGNLVIRVTATDSANASVSTTFILNVVNSDSTPPTASIVMADTELTAGEVSLVTITFSEAVSGFDNSDLTVEGGTLSAVSSNDGGVIWTATFTPTANLTDATNVITLNNAGVAGNAGTGTTPSNNYAVATVPVPQNSNAVIAPTPTIASDSAPAPLSESSPVESASVPDSGSLHSFLPAASEVGLPSGGVGIVSWSALSRIESGSGSFTAPAASGDLPVGLARFTGSQSEALVVSRGVPDLVVDSAGTVEARIPVDAFAHTDPLAGVQYALSLANGQALPAWVAFDPSTGKLKITPPPGFEGVLELEVTARDEQGNEAKVAFRVVIGRNGLVERPAPAGRAGLSEQFRLAARFPHVTDRLAALAKTGSAHLAARARG